MKPKSTLASLLLAGLTTVALASTAQAAPATTGAALTVPNVASTLVPAKNDKPYTLLYGTKNGTPKARWNPCSAITWGVIEKGMVAEEIPRITQAFATISAATGLKFKYKGVSKKQGKSPHYKKPTIPGVDIAIKFEDFAKTYPKEVESAAYGGAQYEGYTSRIGSYEYGYVRVDTPDLPGISEPLRESLFLHELGHVIGLDHKAGPNIMNATLQEGITAFSPGDLAGLKVLGRQAKDCGSASPFRG